MKKIKFYSITLVAFLVTGCGSSNNKNSNTPIDTTTSDILISTMFGENLAYLSTFNGSKEANLTVDNAMEIAPMTRPYVYKDKIYATQIFTSNIVLKIDENNGTLTKNNAQLELGANNMMPGSPIFLSETKAYLPLTLTGELAVFNPTTMELIEKIDLSAYAIGNEDVNPEPMDGIIRDGKLYLALWQTSNLQPTTCRGMSSMLILDTNTDKIDKSIEDNRTCVSSVEAIDAGIFLDENNDIYLYNTATYSKGSPEFEAGFLRIKDGESDFDPEYFFSIPKLYLPDGEKADWLFQGVYGGNGKYYTLLNIPTLASNPPDYVNDRTMQPFVLDLYKQSAQKINLPVTNAWSQTVIKYKEKYLYGLSTTTGIGIYRYDPVTKEADQKPFINTEGMPIVLKNLK